MTTCLFQLIPLALNSILVNLYQYQYQKPYQITQLMLSSSLNLKQDCGTLLLQPHSLCKKEEHQNLESYGNCNFMENRLQKIDMVLSSFSQLRMCNILNHLDEEKMQILSIVESLCCEVSKLQEAMAKMSSYQRKRDEFLLHREEMLEKMVKERKVLQYEKQSSNVRKQHMERVLKQSNEKHAIEREDLQKQLRKIQIREKSFEAQFRKKDNQIRSLQEAIKRAQQKNHSKTQQFEVFHSLDQNQRKDPDVSPSRCYDLLALGKFEDVLKRISQENAGLKGLLQKLILHVNSISQVASQKLRNLCLQVEGAGVTSKLVKPESINLCFEYALPNFEYVFKNLKLVQRAVGLLDCDDVGRHEISKQAQIPPTWRINSLIQNFKEIVKSQNLILNQSIEGKPGVEASMAKEQKCCLAVEKLEFDSIKQMIQEQMGKVESKNKILSSTKQALTAGLSEAERIKHQLAKEKDGFWT